MDEDNADKSKKSLWIIVSCACFVVIGAAVTLLLKNKPDPISEPDRKAIRIAEIIEKPDTPFSKQQPLPTPSKDAPAKIKPPESTDQPVVDYGKFTDDEAFQALMEKRKEKYGFEKGVDLIVKPDELVKVGDEVIPMQEILEKIRRETEQPKESKINRIR